MNLPPLRPYQARLVAGVRASIRAGHRAIVGVLPCGGGKTNTAAHCVAGAVDASWPVLWCAQTDELLEQARGVLPAGVTVESIQALAARLAAGQPVPDARLVVCDEAHHLAADRWRLVPDHYLGAGAIVLGLTATPERGDGRPLAPPFAKLIVGAQYSDLLAAGVIVPAEVYAPTARGNALALPVREALDRYLPGQRAIVFAATVAEAEALAREIPRAACVSARTPRDERRAIMTAFRAGALDVLTNVDVLTEGVDVPDCAGVVVAGPVGTVGGWIQRTNRCMRAAPGKRRGIVVDLLGCIHTGLGLPHQDRTYSLAGERGIAKRADDAPPLWQCRRCWWVGERPPGNRTCPHCGARMPEPEALRVRRAQLMRYEADARRDDEGWRRERERLEKVAIARGYKRGWVEIQLRARMARGKGAA